jgi:hypothetical protein
MDTIKLLTIILRLTGVITPRWPLKRPIGEI